MKNKIIGLTSALMVGLFLCCLPVRSSEWQWSALVRNGLENSGLSRAYLWVPPDCKQLRGVVFAQHNMEEIMILENPAFRKTMTELGFAEVWCAPSFDGLFRFTQGALETFQGIMSDLANTSGYSELNFLPVVYMGHSAAASAPYYFAASNPERTLAALSVSGQWPYVRNAFAPDIWGNRSIDFIPCLETMGEYESANTWSGEGLKERQQHPSMPLSMLACPAEGHFTSSDKKSAYLAFYIRKAAEYRLPKDVPNDKPVKLIPIDPASTGWYMDKWRFDQTPTAIPAPVKEYKGNVAEAFWFFDEETVRETEKYESAYRGFKAQLIGYSQNGKVLPQNNSHLQVNPKFLPAGDGVTFTLEGVFYDTVPGGSPRLPGWAGLPVGSPIGHSQGGVPISIDKVCGPFVKLGPDKFALRLDKSAVVRNNRMELVFAATHPGDAVYKPAVQQASMSVAARLTEGQAQTITFPEIPNQKTGAKSVVLKASCDSRMPVYYYILEGPAEVEGNVVTFTKIPQRAKYPVKVTIVAWQYGCSTEPKRKSAEQVERSFFIQP